ncbi:fatty acid--CoA ligase family protein [Agromyces atrinae]|uniref:ANL family adenylate-forming protein n=1 Tax=Agromyces atrinae TaxID=592376 RepID=UPI001F588691|nr:fatty acid--CoA ligase family protein [Agromyces atrinae]MCI2957239.1 fatty acid--CoA ligase family protein [Agromyces atrinae]
MNSARPRLTLIDVGDETEAARQVLAVRRRGGVPLAIDRRGGEFGRNALAALASIGLPTGSAWASATSGSSGDPRVVVRTASSWESSFDVVDRLVDRRPDDVLGALAPLASSMTLFSLAYSDARGLPLVLGGPGRSRERLAAVTLAHGTPYAVRELIESRAAPRLRRALVGGAKADDALLASAERHGVELVTYYGATELSFVAADTGSGLRALPGVEVRVDPDGTLSVRSPFVAESSIGGRRHPFAVDAEGWATVGDRAALAADGTLTLHGRSDDAILSSGATVVPGAVEAALRAAPGVADVLVFARPAPRIGALVAAAVEASDPANPPSTSVLRAHAAAHLSTAERPRQWFVVDALPRSANGKPLRAALADAVSTGDLRPHV